MKLLLSTLLLFLVLTISCNKEKEEPSPEGADNSEIINTELKIRHNWTFDYTVLNIFGSNPDSDTIYGQNGDYYNFLTNNEVVAHWNNISDTVNYNVLGAGSLLYAGDTMEIVSLNSSEFIFKRIEKTDTTDYENIVRLSK